MQRLALQLVLLAQPNDAESFTWRAPSSCATPDQARVRVEHYLGRPLNLGVGQDRPNGFVPHELQVEAVIEALDTTANHGNGAAGQPGWRLQLTTSTASGRAQEVHRGANLRRIDRVGGPKSCVDDRSRRPHAAPASQGHGSRQRSRTATAGTRRQANPPRQHPRRPTDHASCGTPSVPPPG